MMGNIARSVTAARAERAVGRREIAPTVTAVRRIAAMRLEIAVRMPRMIRSVMQGLGSVREVERNARAKGADTTGKSGAAKPDAPKSPNLAHLAKRLAMSLGLVTNIEERGPGRGRVQIDYATLDDLDRLLAKLFG